MENSQPQVNGGPPQQRPAHQPMQEHYPESDWEVQTDANTGQRLLIIQVPLPRKVLVFPMSPEIAQQRGALLSAPSVVRPS